MSLSIWTTWLTQALENLYNPLLTFENLEFNPLFCSIFSPDAVINVNHESVPVSALEERIKSEVVASNLVLEAKVDWKELFEVPERKGGEGGVVAGFFVVTRTMKLRIRAGPAETLGYRFFSAKVVKDETDGEGDHWRIAEFFLTETNKPAPIHLAS